MKKENCLYCNLPDTKFENYIIIKPNIENICVLCDKEYENVNDKYYSKCCLKNSCSNCLKEWYHTLIKEKCLFCGLNDILFEDFKNEYQHEEMKLNEQSGVKYTKKTKLQFLEYYIRTKIYSNCKIIFCSNYIKIFNDMKKLLIKYNISYIELDDGNVDSIYNSINNYKHGNINVLLLNSNLFGCGLNLESTTDIIFLHKMDNDLEKQIIGRAQRPGRKEALNIWYIMHENETVIKTLNNNSFFYKNSEIKLDIHYDLEGCEGYTEI
jgi:peroxiredoxin family protein